MVTKKPVPKKMPKVPPPSPIKVVEQKAEEVFKQVIENTQKFHEDNKKVDEQIKALKKSIYEKLYPTFKCDVNNCLCCLEMEKYKQSIIDYNKSKMKQKYVNLSDEQKQKIKDKSRERYKNKKVADQSSSSSVASS
jgi:hypothetical protein